MISKVRLFSYEPSHITYNSTYTKKKKYELWCLLKYNFKFQKYF